MSGSKSRPDPETLLAHREFVRGLALRLVGDEHKADDLVQETWLAALEGAPARPRSLRAWLARVARNLTLKAARGEIRRTQREHRASRPDRSPGAADVVERLAVERRVVDAVMALDEPFRTTLLLRFYEDLPPREIAHRLDVPAATVRTRLKRGLDRLRARLDPEFGGSRGLMLALVPLLVPTASAAMSAAATGGILIMTVQKKLLALAAVLMASLGVLFLATRPDDNGTAHPRAARVTPGEPSKMNEAHGAAGEAEPTPPRRGTVRIAVRVEDRQGNPVDGARVECVAQDHVDYGVGTTFDLLSVRPEPDIVDRATTDSTGRAAFDSPLAGSYRFVATKTGLSRGVSPSLRLHDPADARDLVIRLDRAYRLTGRVVDSKGDPLADARVLAGSPEFTWNHRAAEPPLRATTGADGSFSFNALPPRDVSLWAARAGGVPYHIQTISFPTISHYTIVLERGGVLKGRVTHKKTGRPLKGARVAVMGYFQHRAEAHTDGDGRYVIDSLPPTRLQAVEVTLDGYYEVRASEKPPLMSVPLESGDRHVHDTVLATAPHLRGVLRGPDGPIPWMTVQSMRQSGPFGIETSRTSTDAEGRYELHLRPGRHILQTGSRELVVPNYAWQDPKLASGEEPWIVDMPQEGELVRDLELVWNDAIRGTSEIAGHVVDLDGSPLAGVKVWGSVQPVLTDASGAFRLLRVRGGTIRLWAVKPGWHQENGVEVQLDAGQVRDGVVVELEKVPAVSGQVRGKGVRDPYLLLAFWGKDKDAWQDPMRAQAWARIWQEARRVPVRADGSYRIEDLSRSGRTLLRAGALNMARSEPVEVVYGSETFDFELKPGAPISGRVIDKRTRATIYGVHIRAKPLSEHVLYRSPYSGNQEVTVRALTDGDGRFTIAHRVGEYKLLASARGYLEATAAEVRAGDRDVLIEMDQDLVIEGVVRYADGKPAPGLKIRTQNDAGEFKGWVADTGRDGRFRARRLRPGRYRITVGGLTARTVTVGPVDAGTRGVEIRVQYAESGEGEAWPQPVDGSGEIRGRIVDPAGKGLKGYHVWARNEINQEANQYGRPATTGENGHFAVRGLDTGTYHLRASAPGGLMLLERRGVVLGAGDVEFVFDKLGGILLDESGKPLAGRQIRAAASIRSGYRREAITGTDGRFVIEGIPPGEVHLSVKRTAGRPNVLLRPATTKSGEENLRVVATLGARIAGTVTDERGNAIDGAWVVARDGDYRYAAKSGPKGAFEITGLKEDVLYNLRVQKKGFVPFERSLRAGAGRLHCALSRGMTAAGRLFDAPGNPLRHVDLRFSRKVGNVYGSAKTDGEGRFEFDGLIEGEYKVWAYRHVDGALKWLPCGTIRAGERDADLRLR